MFAITALIQSPGSWTSVTDWSNGSPGAGDIADIGTPTLPIAIASLDNGNTNEVNILRLGGTTAGTQGSLLLDGSGTALDVGTIVQAGAFGGQGSLIVANGSKLSTPNLVAGQFNTGLGTAEINVDATSQLNITSDLTLVGANEYTLPLASEPKDGKVSFGRNLRIGSSTNNDVTLNVDATSALSSSYTGSLQLGSLASGGRGELHLDSVHLSFSSGRLAQGSGSSGVIELTNGAVLDAGVLRIGELFGSETNASVSIDPASQLNTNFLFLNGGGSHTLPIASTPTDGKLSLSHLNVGTSQNNDVSLNLHAATSADSNGLQSLTLGGFSANGELHVDGVELGFSQSLSIGSANGSGTLTLKNGALVGARAMSLDQNTLFGSTQLAIDSSSQLKLDESAVFLNGSYSFTLTDTPTDGALSITESAPATTTLGLNPNLGRVVDVTIEGAADSSGTFQGNLDVARNQGEATLHLNSGDLSFQRIRVGDSSSTSSGTIQLNNANLFASNEIAMRTQADSASATVVGTGSFGTATTFIPNGRVVADGGDLDVSFQFLANNVRSTLMGDSQQAGWYATNGGRLTLDPVSVAGDVNWGESSSDTSPDLVNSIRLRNWTNLMPGPIEVSLLANDNATIPLGLVDAVGVWKLDQAAGPLVFDAVDLLIRYDDIAAGGDQESLRLLRSGEYVAVAQDGINWQDITGDLDTSNGLISGNYSAITPNTPPVAHPDVFEAEEDVVFVSPAPGVLENDTNAPGDILTASELLAPSNGNLEMNADGSFNYTPNPGFHGTDTFTYEVCDSHGACDTAIVSILVLPINDAPIAGDDTFTIDEDAPIEISAASLLSNDTDADGDSLAISVLAGPYFGTLTTLSDGSYLYLPDVDYHGHDSFVYIIDDGFGGTDSGIVQITIQPINDIAPDSIALDEDTSATIIVLANDSFEDVSAYVSNVTEGNNGTVSLNSDSTITYTPDPNFFGTDSFTYTVTTATANATSNSETAIVAVTVHPVIDLLVDVKPGNGEMVDRVNLNSKGQTPIAILSTQSAVGEPKDFDATAIDWSVATIMINGVALSPLQMRLDDVDDDGDTDLLLHFLTQDLAALLTEESVDLVLSVELGGAAIGDDLLGADEIRIVP